MKQTAVLGSPVYIRQAQGKNLKRGAKVRPGPLSSLRIFWVSMPSNLEDVFSFIFEIKLSCNTGPSKSCYTGPPKGCNAGPCIASNFSCNETEPRKLCTPPTSIVLLLGLNLAETTSVVRPPQGGGKGHFSSVHFSC